MTNGDRAEGGGFRPQRHGVAYALLLAWCAGVWFLSSRPDPGDTIGFAVDLPDWLLHGIEYAVGGILAAAAFSHLRSPLGVVTAIAFCVAYGVLDEWHQSHVPGRHADLGDVAADTVGTVLGVLAWTAFAGRSPSSAP